MKEKFMDWPRWAQITSVLGTFLLIVVLILNILYFLFIAGLPFGKIIPNVSVAGVHVGGMSYRQALQAAEAATAGTYGKIPMAISVRDKQLMIAPDAVIEPPDIRQAVKAAYAYGRTGMLGKRHKEQLNAQENGYRVNLFSYMTVDTGKIQEQIQEFSKSFPAEMIKSSWELQGPEPVLTQDNAIPQTLVITVGAPGYLFDENKLMELIINAYNSNQFSFIFNCPVTDPAPLDMEEIYKQVSKAPVDSVIDPKTHEIQSHINGYDFYLKSALNQISRAKEGDVLEIPMRILPAKVKQQDLSSVLFRDQLATFTAKDGSSKNRDKNLSVACKAVNGTVIMPGEVFSFNGTTGKPSPENGYRPAGTYHGNQAVTTYGGGICQVASCIYYTALMADLDIVARTNHQFASSYMPLGMDANVQWDKYDFKFRNSTDYPIRIDAVSDGGAVTVTLVGTDNRDYYVKMETDVLEKQEYRTLIKQFPVTNEKGYQEGDIITTPYTGYVVASYRNKYKKSNDELISQEYEVTSTYEKRDEVICQIVVSQQ